MNPVLRENQQREEPDTPKGSILDQLPGERGFEPLLPKPVDDQWTISVSGCATVAVPVFAFKVRV